MTEEEKPDESEDIEIDEEAERESDDPEEYPRGVTDPDEAPADDVDPAQDGDDMDTAPQLPAIDDSGEDES